MRFRLSQPSLAGVGAWAESFIFLIFRYEIIQGENRDVEEVKNSDDDLELNSMIINNDLLIMK